MNFTKTSELPFTVCVTTRFFDEDLPLSPETKLLGFSRLERGWCNGEGQPISRTAVRVALRLLDAARGGIIEATDVFPRIDGGITVAVYYSEGDLAFNIAPSGSVDIDSETDSTLPLIEGLSTSHALFIIGGLRKWKWSCSYTLPTTMSGLAGSEALVSRDRGTAQAFPLSTRVASSRQQAPYVLTPALFTVG